MLLLNTTTYALERVARPDKYAILSHTWEADEVTFDDMKSLDEAKRKGGWSKVQQACRVAAEISRCKYIWIDSCCIDKSSSAELSEAINSMFSYYQDAEVCYVYLSDLLDSSGSGIRLNLSRCRWFTRGWTLQELVAPRMIIFYNHRWDFIGSKQSLMDQLVNITNIDRSVLVDASVLSTVPVGRRMGWAAKRQTTRVEDAAYCLLGIFDVNMPMIYGEGGKAFIRLQEAIALTTNDLSLFAWSDESPNPWHQSYQGIFARSPVQFSDCHLLENVHDPLEYNTRSLAITNRGVEFQTSLQSDRENGDYLMFLHCRQGTAGYGPSGEVETIAIRLLKTPNGFIRHRSDVVFHDRQRVPPEIPALDLGLVPRSVNIPKTLSQVEISRLPFHFRHSIAISIIAVPSYRVYVTSVDPRRSIRPSETLFPSSWDHCRTMFLTEGHRWFTGQLYLVLFRNHKSSHHLPPIVLFCGFHDSSSGSTDLKPWVMLYGESPWKVPMPDFPAPADTGMSMREIVTIKNSMPYPHSLSYTGQKVREKLFRGDTPSRSLINQAAMLQVSASVSTIEGSTVEINHNIIVTLSDTPWSRWDGLNVATNPDDGNDGSDVSSVIEIQDGRVNLDGRAPVSPLLRPVELIDDNSRQSSRQRFFDEIDN